MQRAAGISRCQSTASGARLQHALKFRGIEAQHWSPRRKGSSPPVWGEGVAVSERPQACR